VGLCPLATVVLVCVVSYPARVRRRWLRPLVEVGFVAVPLVVISSKAGEAWARGYALHVSAAALAVVIALRARCVGRREAKELRACIRLQAGFCQMAIIVLPTE
jgi:hypothetical protein